jgi:Putative adhesin
MRYALVAALLTLAAGTAVAVGYFAIADVTAVTKHRTHVVRGDVSRIVVDSADGDVDVRATSADDVTVRETRHSWMREPELRMSLRDGVLDIAVECPNLSPGCADDLEITAPRDVRLAQVDVDSGDVSVAGLASGRVVARSDSGDVEVRGVGGPVVAAADSGDVLADDVRGALTLSADSGDVTGSRLHGDRVSGRADSGDVSLGLLVAPRLVTASADSGDVEVAVPTGRYRIEAAADSGEVDIERVLRDDLAGRRIDARADSGDVVVRGG